ncbi:MAG: PQQ-binding-like beta-propeller repeat protein [Gemmatimonadota bacterium]
MKPAVGRSARWMLAAAAALGVLLCGGGRAEAQERANPEGEWRYWGADAWSTRYSPLDQIDRNNFEDLEIAWTWRGDNFGPSVDYINRATPIYAAGRLFTVAGRRRTAVAIDPATGETLWTFREPQTRRWERSSRQNYGKGVAYAEVDGRGVVYLVTPAFFLHALDAATGRPLEGFGAPVPLEGFADHGTVDMLADLGHPYDPDGGIPAELGYVTNTSPPIVVNGVVIVGNSNLTGRLDPRRENVPGDVLAYDARTGEHLWTFNVIPRPGEFGHDTWENDAWEWSGNINTWPPLSADPDNGIVYVTTDAPTNDYFGGHRPGDNLFGNSIIALDAETGERLWHFQAVHHDVWDRDFPHPPQLMDVTVDGRRIPALVQSSKQGFIYAFNRLTGEPIWPIVERPVPQSKVPTEQTAATQPHPTRPAAYEMQGLTEDDLVDYTPELRQRALERLSRWDYGPSLFVPPLHDANDEGKIGAVFCPSAGGGTNIPGGTVADPETGIIYVASVKSCADFTLVPGVERDAELSGQSGVTPVEWTHAPAQPGLGSIDGIPLWKPPYGRITAIDMNTGEHLWWIPNGDTPERIRNHPLLRGVDLPVTGRPSHATAVVTRSLLIYGEGRGGEPILHAVDKRTGELLGSVALPANTNTAPMTYMHDGVQYTVLSVAGAELPASFVALRLPAAEVERRAASTGGSRLDEADVVITPFAGASVQIEHEGTVIHVDPWSRGDYADARPADLILVTDTPPDHLDPDLIGTLRKPGAPVVVPDRPDEARDEGSRGRLLRVPDATVMDNGDRLTLAGVGVEAVPMYDIIPGEPFHAKGEGNGYILTLGGTRVYLAGVTECIPEMADIRDIDVMFVPMNLPHGRMPPSAAAECVKAIRPRVVYPYHYRQQPIEAFVDALAAEPDIEVRLHDWYPPGA